MSVHCEHTSGLLHLFCKRGAREIYKTNQRPAKTGFNVHMYTLKSPGRWFDGIFIRIFIKKRRKRAFSGVLMNFLNIYIRDHESFLTC